ITRRNALPMKLIDGSLLMSHKQLVSIKMGDDFIEDCGGAILDGAKNAEQHPAGHAAPTPIAYPCMRAASRMHLASWPASRGNPPRLAPLGMYFSRAFHD